VEIEVLPLDAFTRVGQEVREVLERRPASMVAVRIVRPRFVERTSPQGECQAAREGVVLTNESGDLPSLIAPPRSAAAFTAASPRAARARTDRSTRRSRRRGGGRPGRGSGPGAQQSPARS